MELVEVEREDPALVKVRAEAQDKLRLGREQLPRLPRPELLDVVDRHDVEDRPNLPETVKRTERDADPRSVSGPAGAARQAAQPTSRTNSLAPSAVKAFFLTTPLTAERSCSAHAPTASRRGTSTSGAARASRTRPACSTNASTESPFAVVSPPAATR